MFSLENLPQLSQRLALVANGIFLAYLVVIASAAPNWLLISAVSVEVAFFIGLLCYRKWNSTRSSTKQASAALDFIERDQKSLFVVRRFLAGATSAVLLVACAYAVVDFSALLLARIGNVSSAIKIYKSIAIAPTLGVHPGLSMELLTGALIESGNFQAAEPLEKGLLQLRLDTVGEQNELTAAMYANIADFYAKWNKPQIAEDYYLDSIALTKQLNLRQGWGSPMTKLGTLLLQEHRYSESDAAFKNALAIRTQIFGQHSAKVGETLTEYSKLLENTGRSADLAAISSQLKSINIDTEKRENNSNTSTASLIILAAALIFFWQRDRVLVRVADYLKQRKGVGCD